MSFNGSQSAKTNYNKSRDNRSGSKNFKRIPDRESEGQSYKVKSVIINFDETGLKKDSNKNEVIF